MRRVLTVLDGVVAGEGEGPLAPRDVPLGVVLASADPLALDLAAVRLMGFDEARLPKLQGAMTARELRVTEVRAPGDVEVGEVDPASFSLAMRSLDALHAPRCFEAHPGWRGHVERAR